MPAVVSMTDDVTTAAEAMARYKATREKFYPSQNQQQKLLVWLREENTLLNNKCKTLACDNLALKEQLESLKKSLSITWNPNPDLPAANIRDIQLAICAAYEVTLVDLISARRLDVLVRPRQVAMFLARKLTLQSLPGIGKAFNRDHTTILHAVNQCSRVWAMIEASVDGKCLNEIIAMMQIAWDGHYGPISAKSIKAGRTLTKTEGGNEFRSIGEIANDLVEKLT